MASSDSSEDKCQQNIAEMKSNIASMQSSLSLLYDEMHKFSPDKHFDGFEEIDLYTELITLMVDDLKREIVKLG